MSVQQIVGIVEGTADPAFAIDGLGLIIAWNTAATELFGLSKAEALGRSCYQLLQGTDDGGVTCSEHCAIRQALEMNRTLANFDLQIETRTGRQWCNISILIVTEPRSLSRHAVHIVRPRDLRKRFEQLFRDFLVTETELSPEAAARLLSSARVAAINVKLTARETEVLRLLARGAATRAIADQLSISKKTANNHITNILAKLDAHNRLEAVRRAEHAGLI